MSLCCEAYIHKKYDVLQQKQDQLGRLVVILTNRGVVFLFALMLHFHAILQF